MIKFDKVKKLDSLILYFRISSLDSFKAEWSKKENMENLKFKAIWSMEKE
jgi:hypothetical protein